MFKKIRFHSRDSLGFEKLELPPQTLETVAMWFAPPEHVVERMARPDGLVVGEALIGIANVLVEVAPLFVMCDHQDIGTVVDASCLGRDALFLHDRYPGGMGYARRCLDRFDEILATIRRSGRRLRLRGRLPVLRRLGGARLRHDGPGQRRARPHPQQESRRRPAGGTPRPLTLFVAPFVRKGIFFIPVRIRFLTKAATPPSR